jgi:uncharacterized membrane protein
MPWRIAETATPEALAARRVCAMLCAMTAPVLLDAVIEPARSLSGRGCRRVMLGLAAAATALGGGFWAMGAYPVIGFMGLELLALALVFRMSFRAQRARTFVRVTPAAVDVRMVDAGGRAREAQLPAERARVDLVDERAGGGVRLASTGRSLTIGRELNPDERASFADRLRAALREARRRREAGGGGEG